MGVAILFHFGVALSDWPDEPLPEVSISLQSKPCGLPLSASAMLLVPSVVSSVTDSCNVVASGALSFDFTFASEACFTETFPVDDLPFVERERDNEDFSDIFPFSLLLVAATRWSRLPLLWLWPLCFAVAVAVVALGKGEETEEEEMRSEKAAGSKQ